MILVRPIRFSLLLALGACFPFTPLTCRRRVDVGQFGPYIEPFKLIRLPSGDTLTVYRVKYWTFTNGDPSALQLEYQTRVAIDDTAAVRTEAMRLWPVFRPYVEEAGTSTAFLTAADRHAATAGAAHLMVTHYFGTVLSRDSVGMWRSKHGSATWPDPLPIGGTIEDGVGIFERSGQPLVMARSRWAARTSWRIL
jgi:hypothetical protein